MTESEPAQADAFVAHLRRVVDVWSAPHRTRDEINQAMIRHWCDAMDDGNPVYTDPERAARSVHGGIVAPPAMLDSWAMVGLAPRPDLRSPTGAPAGMLPLMKDLDDAGFTSVVATSTAHEYDRYLRLGDRLHARQAVTAVSPEKKTALGVGHFLTSTTEFTEESGERVGRMEFCILKFKPGTGSVPAGGGAAPAGRIPRPRPAISRDTRFFWDGIDQGELRIQRCEACHRLHHPPVVRCPACGSYELGWIVSSGRGRVYSHAEVHHPQFPMFDYPVVAVLVELEEGSRILSHLVGVAEDEVRVDMPVEVTIDEVDPGVPLPLFRRARPPRREATLRLEDVAAGEELAPCPVPVTPTLIVAGAMASRDFQDVHHDPNLARKRGSPDIFMNIMTTAGLTTRYVTDWAGPEARVRSMRLRLGVPNYPGDLMTFRGQVAAAEARNGSGRVELAVRGSNRLGDHVTATFELELPSA